MDFDFDKAASPSPWLASAIGYGDQPRSCPAKAGASER